MRLLILLASLALGGSAYAQPEPAVGGELYPLDHVFSIKDGTRVRIVNPYGDVRIREVPMRANAQLRVMVQTDEGVENPARLNIEALDDGVHLAIKPVAEGRLSAEQGFLRADFVIALPDRVVLDVEMDEGSFTMHAATYPVKVRAREGKLTLRTTGELDVEVLGGHVVLQQGGGDTPIVGGRLQTSGAPVDVLGADLGRINYETISGAAVTTDSVALLQARTREGRTYRFEGDPDNPTLHIQTDAAPIRLVVDGIR